MSAHSEGDARHLAELVLNEEELKAVRDRITAAQVNLGEKHGEDMAAALTALSAIKDTYEECFPHLHCFQDEQVKLLYEKVKRAMSVLLRVLSSNVPDKAMPAAPFPITDETFGKAAFDRWISALEEVGRQMDELAELVDQMVASKAEQQDPGQKPVVH